MINLSLNELKPIAQIRNISDYENKSKEDLIKAVREPKPETLKPGTKPKQTLKPETKLEVKFNRKILKKTSKRFWWIKT